MCPLLVLAAAAAIGPLLDVARAVSQRTLVPLRVRLASSAYRLGLFTFTSHFTFLAFLSLAIGKVGSNINYFLDRNLSAGPCRFAGDSPHLGSRKTT